MNERCTNWVIVDDVVLTCQYPPSHGGNCCNGQTATTVSWLGPRPPAPPSVQDLLAWFRARPGMSWRSTALDIEWALGQMTGSLAASPSPATKTSET